MLNGSVTGVGGEPIVPPVEETGIHAILIEMHGGMSELWLPATIEGKHTFPLEQEYISITADGGNWKASVANGGYFLVAEPDKKEPVQKREIPIYSNTLHIAHVGKKVFSLYLEDDCDSSRVFHPYYLEADMDIYIGRDAACDLQYHNRFVTRKHAIIKNLGDHFVITDHNSANGVYVNGRRVQASELRLGDVVHILGLCMVVGAGYIAINKSDQCEVLSERLVPLGKRYRLPYLPAAGTKWISTTESPVKSISWMSGRLKLNRPRLPCPRPRSL